MIENHEDNYDYILFVRPDCFYINKLDLKWLNLINYNNIIIPDFHVNGKYKINDRFSITNKHTYKIYGKIFLQLLDLSKKMPLHSETILGLILHNNNIIVIRVNFKFARVRYNGTINNIDKHFIKKQTIQHLTQTTETAQPNTQHYPNKTNKQTFFH